MNIIYISLICKSKGSQMTKKQTYQIKVTELKAKKVKYAKRRKLFEVNGNQVSSKNQPTLSSGDIHAISFEAMKDSFILKPSI